MTGPVESDTTLPLILRPARLEDVPILELWDTEPAIASMLGEDDYSDWTAEIANDDPHSEQLIAELAGRPIGFMQIIDPQQERTHFWGEVAEGLRAIDIWIGAASDRGRGLGTRMMQLAHHRCFRHFGARAILLDPLASNASAIRFYVRLGYRQIERRIFAGGDDCWVMQLDRSDWERSAPPT